MPSTGQQQIEGTSPPRVTWRDDFIGLFGNSLVMPTPLRVLEQGENLLFVHHYGWNKEITKKQDQIYRLLVRYGAGLECPGTITVICVWGLANTHREVLIYDPIKGKQARVAVTNDELRQIFVEWWIDKKRSRR